jgi:hypothetical protein
MPGSRKAMWVTSLAVKLGKQTKSRLLVTDREGVELADSEAPPTASSW